MVGETRGPGESQQPEEVRTYILVREWPRASQTPERLAAQTVADDHLADQLNRIAAKWTRENLLDPGSLEYLADVPGTPDPDAELFGQLDADAVQRIAFEFLIARAGGRSPAWPCWQVIHAEPTEQRAWAVVDALKERTVAPVTADFMVMSQDEVDAGAWLVYECELEDLQRRSHRRSHLELVAHSTRRDWLHREAARLSGHLEKHGGNRGGSVPRRPSKGWANTVSFRIIEEPSGIHWLERRVDPSPQRNSEVLAELGIDEVGVTSGGETQAQAVFFPDGDTWVIRFGGEEWRFNSSIGFGYIHKLLQSPDQAIDVWILEFGKPCPDHERSGPEPIMDEQAIAEIEGDVEDAAAEFLDAASRTDGPVDRERLDVLRGQIRGAKDKDGKPRSMASGHEKCRGRVGKAIQATLKDVEEKFPLAGKLLRASIKSPTGYAPRYEATPGLIWVTT